MADPINERHSSEVAPEPGTLQPGERYRVEVNIQRVAGYPDEPLTARHVEEFEVAYDYEGGQLKAYPRGVVGVCQPGHVPCDTPEPKVRWPISEGESLLVAVLTWLLEEGTRHG